MPEFLGHIVAQVAADCHAPGFPRMLELAMAALGFYERRLLPAGESLHVPSPEQLSRRPHAEHGAQISVPPNAPAQRRRPLQHVVGSTHPLERVLVSAYHLQTFAFGYELRTIALPHHGPAIGVGRLLGSTADAIEADNKERATAVAPCVLEDKPQAAVRVLGEAINASVKRAI